MYIKEYSRKACAEGQVTSLNVCHISGISKTVQNRDMVKKRKTKLSDVMYCISKTIVIITWDEKRSSKCFDDHMVTLSDSSKDIGAI